MTTQSVSYRSLRENVFVAPQGGGSLHHRIVAIVREWRRRVSSRHELATLSDLDLKDIGYPARVEAEKSKPFWRA